MDHRDWLCSNRRGIGEVVDMDETQSNSNPSVPTSRTRTRVYYLIYTFTSVSMIFPVEHIDESCRVESNLHFSHLCLILIFN